MASLVRSASALPLLAGVLVAAALAGLGCSSSSDPLPSAHPDNPLPECPDSPNCERVSKAYPVSAERLYTSAQEALTSLHPAELQFQSDSMRASAVHRVALVFKDDLDLIVQSRDDSSLLHIRSASRVGYSDLGVNHDRVQRLLSAVEDELRRAR